MRDVGQYSYHVMVVVVLIFITYLILFRFSVCILFDQVCVLLDQVNESFTTVYSGGRDRRVWATDLRNPDSRILICEEQAPVLKVSDH